MTIHVEHSHAPYSGSVPWHGLFRLVDPKVSLASLSSILLGAALAAWQGPLAWGWLALTVLGVLALEAAKNASGEIFDFDSGADEGVQPADRSPFSGGKRVLVDGLMSREQVQWTATWLYALGIALGLVIVALREPRILPLGLLGVALAWFYHAPPLSLAYRGLGELAVALCYGPLICCGTYLVQRGTLDTSVLWASLPLGLGIGAFLWINEFPDFRADERAGKRTLVVRLGRQRASRAYAGIQALALLGILLLPLLGLPSTILLGLVGLPFAFDSALRLARAPERTPAVVPAQRDALMAFVAVAVGMAVGLVWLA